MDPALFELDPTSGEAPSVGFSASGKARMFPAGKCMQLHSPEERLEVTVPRGRLYTIRVLDVVTVKICCDDWDARARVPQPRLHLIASSATQATSLVSKSSGSNASTALSTSAPILSETPINKKEPVALNSHKKSIYSITQELRTPAVLFNEPLRCQRKAISAAGNGVASIPGRIVFGEFRNPDTHTAMQEANIAQASEAAQQRRNQALDQIARKNEFERSQRIEKDATARMQRLAANKRNARKSKGK